MSGGSSMESNNIVLSAGMVIKDMKYHTCYRVIYISMKLIVLCEMYVTRLVLKDYGYDVILDLLEQKDFSIEEDEGRVFDADKLSVSVREKYERSRAAMNEITAYYGPTFLELSGRKTKEKANEIMQKYGIQKKAFWKMCREYLQSGMKLYSLVDGKAFAVKREKERVYRKKPGKKSEYIESIGVVVDDKIKEIFDWAIKEYKSGRWKTVQNVYDAINRKYFSKEEVINGMSTIVLLPESRRPTYNQLYWYFRQHVSKEEMDRIKTSAAEQRNNKRLLLSDSMNGVRGPGDMVEIDACEADVSLVSEVDENRTVGRPVVYFMIDVYSRLILAVSVAYDNNSVLGVTNLFLNLADDKREYCSKHGIQYDNDAIWPSNIIPRRLRVDRGSEFKSSDFDRICNELGIEKQIVPGASGSLKGIVEQSFHQMHAVQKVHLENHGLIEQRYDSRHHQEATLTISQYEKMVINFVLLHNQQYNEHYPLTRDMIENKIRPIPALLWRYGIEKYGAPRQIMDYTQYCYNLMTPIKAKVSRKGIYYKNLFYYAPEDKNLKRKMFEAGNKKLPFEARMDMRNIGNIYYIQDGKVIKAGLNRDITGNGDFENITMKQWNDYLKAIRQMDADGRRYNESIRTFGYSVNAAIVREAVGKSSASVSDDKKMHEARELEKQRVSNLKKMSTEEFVIDDGETVQEYIEDTAEEKEKHNDIENEENFEEALSDFWNM